MADRAYEPVFPASIGPYRVVRELGRGGMGVVYEGLHTHLQRRVAIKQMRPELRDDPTQVERFVREGRAACRIRHPNVVDLFELAFVGDVPYLVMDYLEGQTLAQRLDQSGPLPLDSLLEILFPVLSAVVAAHEAGVVHRDLKPANIVLARGDKGRTTPKLLDFGTSKLPAIDAPSLTESSALLGTPYYMAPEQVRAVKTVDARCDQYALGVLLYECCTGVRPFLGDSAYGIIYAIMSAPVTPPSAHVPALPRLLDEVVLRAMEREPDKRFADVRALGAALLPLAPAALADQWRSEFTTDAAPAPCASEHKPAPESATRSDQPRVPPRQAPPPRRARWPLGLSLALLVVLTLVGAALLARSSRAPRGDGLGTAPAALPVGPASDISGTRAPATLRSGAEAARASTQAVPSAPTATALLPSTPEASSPVPLPTQASVPGAAATAVTVSTAVEPAAPLPAQGRAARPGARGPRRDGTLRAPRRAARTATQAEAPALPTASAPVLGDNGAPILE